MGAALNTAGAMGAYVLSDRGTWISFKNKGDLEIVGAKATSACSTSTASSWSIPTSTRREEGAGSDLHRLGDVGRGPERHPRLQIDGQQLFFPNADPGQMKKAG